MEVTCIRCLGSGWITKIKDVYGYPCPTCNGNGVVKINVKTKPEQKLDKPEPVVQVRTKNKVPF